MSEKTIVYGGGRLEGKTAALIDGLQRENRELRAEVLILKRFALRAFRVGEWLAGEGFVGDQPCPEDPDDLFMELAAFLGVETGEGALKALIALPHQNNR